MTESCRLSRRQALLSTAALVPILGACGAKELGGSPTPTPTPPVPGPSDDATPPTSADDAATADASPTGDAASDAAVKPLSAPGLVVEVSHAGSVVTGQVQAGPVALMLARAMKELTGETDLTKAWKAFFSPSDVVGIKVNPFGYPKFFSQIATVTEVIKGLNLAGVPNANIIIFDRYTDMLSVVGYPALLPAGVRFASSIDTAAEQVDLTGYDSNEYVDFPKVEQARDPSIALHRRSYLANIVSKDVTKVINIPVLKDHASAGITFALKNMTYGLVNNTARTHETVDNWTKEFIPGIAGMPKIRKKVVLHIGDALIGCYDGGPDPSDFTFERKAIFAATDAVAMDRIAWKIIDAERAKKGLAPVATIDGRQPHYILACGTAGLGISDLATIEHRSFAL